MNEIERRRLSTSERFAKLREALANSEKILEQKACVYATGSFGRKESGSSSDLDLFIVGRSRSMEDGTDRPSLKRLDEICVKADLIYQTRQMGIPDFDGDGKYLQHYSVNQLTRSLGTPEDDVTNTFTARLLLLLESSPLIGVSIYEEVIESVIGAYWGDYPDHSSDFAPAFLVNDILRLWRTFCVNYEARTEREPEEKRIKRKIKNYKLKYSRLMTCYSALIFLLYVFGEKKTVSPDDAKLMCGMTPTQRVEHIVKEVSDDRVRETLVELLRRYETFLMATSVPEAELIERFSSSQDGADLNKAANSFGDAVFESVSAIGKGGRLHRIIVV
ncbi:nucleotidyltransferase domain-containing protein [Bosea sp. (in: a-proteobacteria)]|uniref:nucleotidyltransferase domain-containing protein n=1 Tax=Bosea sp. (in: a-proteobacteria) TaxID=1871050 RepID=UPI002DDD01C5|nr:nucleotidyltransferase domain-containing protein [Bosea sp. (in: a-proteobacteria)]HEV2509533.1 nucleotidyltransferase domain-containing protein [Bosea sp. (in: a-proteobacteria)]